MDISNEQYKVVFTNTCKQEIENIYNYISKNLYSPKAARKFMSNIEKVASILKSMPRLYRIIKKPRGVSFNYRRVVINNYVLIYTIFEKEKIVYISHVYYGRSNYLDKF